MPYDKMTRFTFTKSGVYYFERRVPRDLKDHYSSRKISYSLRTRSLRIASARAERAAQQLDEYWYHLRLQFQSVPGQHLLRSKLQMTNAPMTLPAEASPKAGSICLSEAVGLYLRLKGPDKALTFRRAAERSCGYMIDVAGDKNLEEYSKADANQLRDYLFEKGMAASSVTRIFGTIRAIFNLTVSELDLSISNPFANVYYDRRAGVKVREPIELKDIQAVQSTCRRTDDELRWLIALISDSGLRLAEAAGLARDDIKLEGDIPHLIVKERPWRRLKTASSARSVPLVGASLWAAKRALEAPAATPYAFPRYNTTETTNANSASAALNKWLKVEVGEKATVHSFRHSMRDRLRAVECPADVVDQIGGWTTEGVGQSYGRGYPMEVLQKWLKLIVQPAG